MILVAIQDEGRKYMTGAAYNALRRIGARNPLRAGYRGSFALLGYTGPGKPAFIRQVMAKFIYLAPWGEGAHFFQ
jgi:hypothetical protein